MLRQARAIKLASVVAVGSLVLAAAACGKPPASTTAPSAAAGKAIVGCMVTDTGGIDDKSFNASAWKGMQDAKAANSNITVKYVESKSDTDYEPNLTQYAQQKCDVVIAVGGLMGQATTDVAQKNPGVQFAIIDDKIDLPNVYSMQFETEQAAFLAGYLAAGLTKTGTVATYGGKKIPPVMIFMDGYVDGVAYYNKQKNKNVKVLGWDKTAQNGTFADDFGDQNKGKAIGETLVAQGADIILPVAGGTGIGTASAALASNGKYNVIWVDQDGCVSADKYCSVFASTVVKNVADAVKESLLKASSSSLGGGGSIGNLQNNGVQLAPFHDFDSKVPADLKTELTQLKQDLISGKVQVTSPSAPK